VNPSLQFAVNPSSGVPICRQLMDQVRAMIVSGQLVAGDLLPSVRLLPDERSINMMTVSKAWNRLEAEGLLERERGTGMRGAPPVSSGTVRERKLDLTPLADPLVTRVQQPGLTDEQILDVVRSVLRERKP
jgi:GntR family transcriptional regulator